MIRFRQVERRRRSQHDESPGAEYRSVVPAHAEWIRMCVAWHRRLEDPTWSRQARVASAGPLGSEHQPWIGLHLGSQSYLVEWIDGPRHVRTHLVRDGSLPEPCAFAVRARASPASLRFGETSGPLSIARAPRFPMCGEFSVSCGPLSSMSGWVTARGRGIFEVHAVVVS